MAMAGREPWVCGACRSINQPREQRCYKCRTPRELGQVKHAILQLAHLRLNILLLELKLLGLPDGRFRFDLLRWCGGD